MSSTPLIACSNGEATVSAITVGFAPGYVARTTMVGGTTWGYSLMGRPGSAMSPTNRMSADSIAAKIRRDPVDAHSDGGTHRTEGYAQQCDESHQQNERG